MDDLKIIFYVIVTILWLFYNNYRRLQKKARERDPSRPSEKEPSEKTTLPDFDDWFPELPAEKAPEPQPKPVVKELKTKPLRSRTSLSERKRTRSPFLDFDMVTENVPLHEGGDIIASQLVDFRSPEESREIPSEWLKEIRQTDWKKAVILSEILNRPYV